MPVSGNDIIFSPPGFHFIDGLEGVDTVDYRGRVEAIVLTLNGAVQSTAYVGGVAEDTIVNIERVYGGLGDDVLRGDALNNLFAGGDGNDLLQGGGGRDQLNGGDGVDTADYRDKTQSVVVTLDRWNEVVVSIGGVAEDVIRNIERVYGGSGNDTLIGDNRANLFAGGDGDDRLQGGLGKDQLNGGDGVDTADYRDKTQSVVVTLDRWNEVIVKVGGVSEDVIRNIERIYGGSANDVLTADDRNNLLSGGGGDDRLNGGLGDDVLRGDAGADRLDGGAGSDTADFSDTDQRVRLSLSDIDNPFFASDVVGTAYLDGVAQDRVTGIENIRGGRGHDWFVGDAGVNRLFGGEGVDRLTGAGGNDFLDGGADDDVAMYAEKTAPVVVTLSGASDVVVLIGGLIEDTLRNIEHIYGGQNNDVITGDDRENSLNGWYGDDILIGGAGIDSLVGDGGDDWLNGGAGNDNLQGNDDADTYAFSDPYSIDEVFGFGDGDDSIALSRQGFTAYLGAPIGPIDPASFLKGPGVAAATSPDHHVIFDTTSGALYYDPDGVGGQAAIQFAILAYQPTLTAADIVLY